MLIFTKKQEERYFEKVESKYSSKFDYIERVVSSCKDAKQLYNSVQWAQTLIKHYSRLEFLETDRGPHSTHIFSDADLRCRIAMHFLNESRMVDYLFDTVMKRIREQ